MKHPRLSLWGRFCTWFRPDYVEPFLTKLLTVKIPVEVPCAPCARTRGLGDKNGWTVVCPVCLNGGWMLTNMEVDLRLSVRERIAYHFDNPIEGYSRYINLGGIFLTSHIYTYREEQVKPNNLLQENEYGRFMEHSDKVL